MVDGNSESALSIRRSTSPAHATSIENEVLRGVNVEYGGGPNEVNCLSLEKAVRSLEKLQAFNLSSFARMTQ